MKYIAAFVFIIGMFMGLAFAFPSTPTPLPADSEYAHFDVQVHNRNRLGSWESPMAAQHGVDCGAPPATHSIQSWNDSVFVCAGHVMTSANGDGYGEIVLTPSQLMNCSGGCTVQWDMSTESLSNRDWPDIWVTPWADNLTLPFDLGDVDQQGVPRQGLHLVPELTQRYWDVNTIANFNESSLSRLSGASMASGIVAGTIQAATRQTFRLTITPGHARFERLPSATASGIVWVDDNCACLLASDYVVQFAHHSYTPTKADSCGSICKPGTWHWNNFILSPSVPFTLIHATTGLRTSNGTVNFSAPAPAGAYLRFSAACKVTVDGVVAPKQRFIGHYEHASPYFVPIAAGKTSVNIAFSSDSWYGPGFGVGCYAQDFAIWSKGGSSTPIPPTATPVIIPTATPIPPTATAVLPTPTATAIPPTPTSTPVVHTYSCMVDGVLVWEQTTPRLCN